MSANGHIRIDAMERRQREMGADIEKLARAFDAKLDAIRASFDQALQSRNRVIEAHEKRIKALEGKGL